MLCVPHFVANNFDLTSNSKHIILLRQTLKAKAELHPGVTVIEVDEPYTSQVRFAALPSFIHLFSWGVFFDAVAVADCLCWRVKIWDEVVLMELMRDRQTCGLCGSLFKTSEKIYECHNSACDYVADRDFNGARNILLRYLTRVVCA